MKYKIGDWIVGHAGNEATTWAGPIMSIENNFYRIRPTFRLKGVDNSWKDSKGKGWYIWIRHARPYWEISQALATIETGEPYSDETRV